MHAEDGGIVRLAILDGVRPHKIVDPVVFGLHHVIGGQRLWDRPQIVQLPQTVADASVHAKDPLVNETRDWEPVERTLYQLVHLWAELEAEQPRALVLEAVPLVHGPVLVVPADQPHPVGVHDLQRQQDPHDLHLVSPPVHEVAVEDVGHALGIARRAEGIEEEKQVSELAVYVPEDHGRRGRDCHGRLRVQQLAHCIRQQHERVQVLRAEQVREQAGVVPLGIELVVLLRRDARGKLLGLLHHRRSPALKPQDQSAVVRRGQFGAALLDRHALLAQGLVLQRREVQDLLVHELPDQGPPLCHDLRVRHSRGSLQDGRLLVHLLDLLAPSALDTPPSASGHGLRTLCLVVGHLGAVRAAA
mmetsp:Transcript_70816/g.207743  ORF Transcript_70816/g.207743 Transcript_70816/m.207743 type:complete len:360 (+) Transcript_70816:1146-2225(+)